MIPPSSLYLELEPEEKVQLQLIVIRHLADELRDMPDYNEKAFRELIEYELYERLLVQERQEKYELCALLRDAIDNLPHISLKQIL